MANGHGGYRRPANPAATSGPGAYSRRTDGQPRMQLPDPAYGEQQDFQQIQAGASMGTPPSVATPAGGGVDPSGLTGLTAPSARPGEPVTAGAPMGAGVGPQAIGLGGDQARSDLEKLRAYLPAFIAQANRPEATQAFRDWVRDLRTELRQ